MVDKQALERAHQKLTNARRILDKFDAEYGKPNVLDKEYSRKRHKLVQAVVEATSDLAETMNNYIYEHPAHNWT